MNIRPLGRTHSSAVGKRLAPAFVTSAFVAATCLFIGVLGQSGTASPQPDRQNSPAPPVYKAKDIATLKATKVADREKAKLLNMSGPKLLEVEHVAYPPGSGVASVPTLGPILGAPHPDRLTEEVCAADAVVVASADSFRVFLNASETALFTDFRVTLLETIRPAIRSTTG